MDDIFEFNLKLGYNLAADGTVQLYVKLWPLRDPRQATLYNSLPTVQPSHSSHFYNSGSSNNFPHLSLFFRNLCHAYWNDVY